MLLEQIERHICALQKAKEVAVVATLVLSFSKEFDIRLELEDQGIRLALGDDVVTCREVTDLANSLGWLLAYHNERQQIAAYKINHAEGVDPYEVRDEYWRGWHMVADHWPTSPPEGEDFRLPGAQRPRARILPEE